MSTDTTTGRDWRCPGQKPTTHVDAALVGETGTARVGFVFRAHCPTCGQTGAERHGGSGRVAAAWDRDSHTCEATP
jgi:hypothetical protein